MVTSDHFCNNCGLRFGNEESLKMHDCENIMAEPEESGSEYEILSDDELFSDNDEIENNISHEEGNLLKGYCQLVGCGSICVKKDLTLNM